MTHVEVRSDGVILDTSDSDATSRALFATGLPIRDLEISGPDLETAFLDLVSGAA